MHMPHVSVVIPAFNAAGYIADTLASVQSQTFQDLEIIVVDDGSTDDTAAVVENFGGAVHLVRQLNSGPGAARNKGIRQAEGTLVAFLDADDIWNDSKLEKQCERFAQRAELGMVFTEHLQVDAAGQLLSNRLVGKRTWLMKGDLVRNILLYSNVNCSTVMVRRAVFDNVGTFDETLPMAEDDNMWIRIAARYPVELIDEPLALYRMHDANTISDRLKLYDCVEKSMESLLQRDPLVAQHLREAVSQKRSYLHFGRGYHHFERRDYDAARREFVKGTQLHRGYWRNHLYGWICCLPASWIDGLRRVKSSLGRIRVTWRG